MAVPQDRDPSPVRSFETFTQDLHRLKGWLQQCRIRTVAMESTGVYWIPLYEIGYPGSPSMEQAEGTVLT